MYLEVTVENSKKSRKVNKQKKKNKLAEKKSSIKSKIFISFMALMLTVIIVLGGVSTYQNYRVIFDTLEQTMTNLTQVSSEVISNELDKYKTVAVDLGLNPVLSDLTISKQVKSEVVMQVAEMYDLVDAFAVSSTGTGESPITREIYLISDKDYFISAMDGNIFISEPAMNKKLNKVTFSVAAPIWKDGEYGSTVNGVAVIVLDGQVLSDIASSVKIGEYGYGFILNKDGLTIGHPDYNKVLAGENIISSYESEGSSESMAKAEKKLLNGEITFSDYNINNSMNFIAYSPIEGSNGWGFFISAPQSEYLSSTKMSIIITLAVSLISLLIAYAAGKSIAAKIADPVIACAGRLQKLADGDLQSELSITDRNDEIGILIKSLNKTIKGLKIIINDISYHLGAIAEGDFSTSIDMEYNGEFDAIALSMRKISGFLNSVVRQVNNSAEQVASGAEQVAGGAVVLSQSTTEQASSVEELSATLGEISEQINSNADYANKANESSLESSMQVESGNNYVKQMDEAMMNINNTSQEISKIIKVIDDIAFQTNILALNAAVEAARAGDAGKGFAVVADEVRNLALKSTEAAKNITALIDNSITAVENGTRVSEQTKKALDLAVERASVVAKMIEEITNASVQQATSVSQVLAGIEQISSIVQTNAATAEESSAASEELNTHARVLKELVAEIKLRSGDKLISEDESQETVTNI